MLWFCAQRSLCKLVVCFHKETKLPPETHCGTLRALETWLAILLVQTPDGGPWFAFSAFPTGT